MQEPLTAPYVLEYTYRRATGPVIGRFLGALTERRILGARTADGRVIVPASEWDPTDGEPTTELVDVADVGTVVGFTFVESPRKSHLRTTPFAFVLVKLDGADTALLHLADADSHASLRKGMRVRARWATERVGAITDIEAFAPIEVQP